MFTDIDLDFSERAHQTSEKAFVPKYPLRRTISSNVIGTFQTQLFVSVDTLICYNTDILKMVVFIIVLPYKSEELGALAFTLMLFET